MKKEEVDIVTEVDERFLQILRILMSGKTLKSKVGLQLEVGIAKTISGNIDFFTVYENRVLCRHSLSDFYYTCKGISDEDITIALAEIALHQINKKEK